MENAFNFLVIILSVFLAIFLILWIIILIYAWKLARTAKRIGIKAEATVNDAQSFVQSAKGAVAPAVAASILSKAVKNFASKSKVKVKK